MAIGQREQALQMIAQLRLLDPAVSAEVGTPERKLIDTVAQAIYDNAIDLDALSAGLDLDSKYGAQLDRFLGIFGYNRQKATFATGFVTFSRTTPSNQDIRIPAGSTIQAPALGAPAQDVVDANTNVPFYTIYDVVLPANSTSVTAPVRASLAGKIGNVGVNRITEIIGSPIFGITGVTNDIATSGGKDAESDEEFKVRFKNTVFRNLAGTQDQYLALAIATAYTTKANVVGPQSFYREYIQVPPVDDASSYDVGGVTGSEAGGGNVGEYTTALSTIPFAKYIYATELPAFVSNGQVGLDSIFYRQDSDFKLNLTNTDRNRGDALRLATAGMDPGAVSLAANTYKPNITFMNVYTGVNDDIAAIRPGQVVLLEFSYMSEASRNDFSRKITNAVDVYIDGGNETLASTVITRPKTSAAFVDDPNSKYHYELYRRAGRPEKRPLIGNVLTPLFWQPTLDVPDQITIGTDTYFKGVHYWAVIDIGSLGGTIRARAGIEWSTKVNGKAQSDPTGDPSNYTGKIITDTTGDPAGGQAIEIENYTYDRNIVDLQAALDGAKQITTDVLAHKSKVRYFKLDVTAMYSSGIAPSDTNSLSRDAVDAYLRSQYYGSAIQLSDLLQMIHETSGMDNVRWSADSPGSPFSTRVYETDENGLPLTGVTVDRIQPGTTGRPEIQGIYLAGQPTGGTFTLSYNSTATSALTYNTSATAIQAALRTITGDSGLTVIEDSRTTTNVRYPLRSFRVTFSTNGSRSTLVPASALTGGPYLITQDFFLRDDELAQLATGIQPGDTVPGLIIRPRAQNTFNRGG